MQSWLATPSTRSNSSACDWECRGLISSRVIASRSASKKNSMLNVMPSRPTWRMTRPEISAIRSVTAGGSAEGYW